MKRTLYLIVSLLLLSGGAFSQKTEALKWLAGIWKISTGNGYLVERWKIVNDSTLQGWGLLVKSGNDSTLQETMELNFRSGEWSYISKVAGQNNNLPVVFKVIFTGRGEFICENATHDFPQRIAYRRIKSQLFASTEGRRNGKYSKQNFDYNSESKMQEQNILIAKSYFEYFSKHDWSKMAALYSDPAEFKDPSFGKEIVKQTRQQTIEKYQQLAKVSSDIRDDIIQLYPSTDKYVIVEFVSSGTAPDGTKWKLPLCTIFTFADGKIVKDFTYYDNE